MDRLTKGRGLLGSLTVEDDIAIGDDLVVAGTVEVGTTIGETKLGLPKVARVRLPSVLGSAAETDSGITLPAKAIVLECFLDVITAEATGGTKTLDVGTDSTDSGDADGYLDGVSVASTGLVKGTLDSGGQTLGTLLHVDESGGGVLTREADIASGGKKITITAGSNDFAELVADLYVIYIDAADFAA